MDNIVLSQLKESFDREEEKLKILQKKEEEIFWKTKGFKTWEEIVSYLKERNIAIQAYSPLCRMIPKIRENDMLKEIAEKHGKSVGQVILRWHIQNHTVPVFKSFSRFISERFFSRYLKFFLSS